MSLKKWIWSRDAKRAAPMECTGASPHRYLMGKWMWAMRKGESRPLSNLIVKAPLAFQIIKVLGIRFAAPKVHVRNFEIAPDWCQRKQSVRNKALRADDQLKLTVTHIVWRAVIRRQESECIILGNIFWVFFHKVCGFRNPFEIGSPDKKMHMKRTHGMTPKCRDRSFKFIHCYCKCWGYKGQNFVPRKGRMTHNRFCYCSP